VAVLRQDSVRRQVIDLSALIRTRLLTVVKRASCARAANAYVSRRRRARSARSFERRCRHATR